MLPLGPDRNRSKLIMRKEKKQPDVSHPKLRKELAKWLLNGENTMPAYVCTPVFNALDKLEKDLPLPEGLATAITNFVTDIRRHGALTDEQKAEYKTKLLNLVPAQENLLLRHTTATRSLYIETQPLRKQIGEIEKKILKEGESEALKTEKAKIQNILDRLHEIYHLFLKECLHLYLKDLNLPAPFDAEDFINFWFLRLLTESEMDFAEVYNSETQDKESRIAHLHKVIIMLLHAMQFQEKFKSDYTTRCQKLYRLLKEGRDEINSYGSPLCNHGIRNKLVTGMLHRDYENLYFLSEITGELQGMISDFQVARLLQLDAENPEKAFKVLSHWIAQHPDGASLKSQGDSPEFDEFMDCQDNLRQYLTSELLKVGIDFRKPEDRKVQDLMKEVREQVELHLDLYRGLHYPTPKGWEKKIAILARLIEEKEKFPKSIQAFFEKIRRLNDVVDFGVDVYFDVLRLLDRAQLYFKKFEGFADGKEEGQLRDYARDLIEFIEGLLGNSPEDWRPYREMLREKEAQLDTHIKISQEKGIVEMLIERSFAQYEASNDLIFRANLRTRMLQVFSEQSLFLDDEALEFWYEAPVRAQEKERTFTPYDINRIIWQGLFTSPLKWSPKFQEVFGTILNVIEKPFQDPKTQKVDDAHTETIRSAYSPELREQLEVLLKIAKKRGKTTPLKLYVRCNLDGVEIIETQDDFINELAKIQPGERLPWIRSIEFQAGFIDKNLFETSLIKEIPDPDYIETIDYLLRSIDFAPAKVASYMLSLRGNLLKNRKRQKDFSVRALNSELYLNSGIRRLYLAFLPCDIMGISQLLECFPVEDRVAAFKSHANTKVDDFAGVLRLLPTKDWSAAIQAKTEWPEIQKLDDFIPFVVLFWDKENLLPLFLNQIGEKLKGIFAEGDVSVNVIECFRALPINAHLVFLKALAPYFCLIFKTDSAKCPYFDIFKILLPNLNEEGQKELISFVPEKLSPPKSNKLHFLQKFLKLLEEDERWDFLRAHLVWLQPEPCESIALLQDFSEEEWPLLNEIFHWDHETENVMPRVFKLSESLWEKALQFLGIPREGLKAFSNLARILSKTTDNIWGSLQQFLTGSVGWDLLIASEEELLNLVNRIIEAEQEGSSSNEVKFFIVRDLLDSLEENWSGVLEIENYVRIWEKFELIPLRSIKGSWNLVKVDLLSKFILNAEDYICAILWLAKKPEANKEFIEELLEKAEFQAYRDRRQYGRILRNLTHIDSARGAQLIAKGFKDFLPSLDTPDFLSDLYEATGREYFPEALSALAAEITQPPKHPLNIRSEILPFLEKRRVDTDPDVLSLIVLNCLAFIPFSPSFAEFERLKEFYKKDLWYPLALECLIKRSSETFMVSNIFHFLNHYYDRMAKTEFNACVIFLGKTLPLERFVALAKCFPSTASETSVIFSGLIRRFIAEFPDTKIREKFIQEISDTKIIQAVGLPRYLQIIRKIPEKLQSLVYRARPEEGKVYISSLSEVMTILLLLRWDEQEHFLRVLKREIDFSKLKVNMETLFQWCGLDLNDIIKIEDLLPRCITDYEKYKELANRIEDRLSELKQEQRRMLPPTSEALALSAALECLEGYISRRPEIFTTIDQFLDFGVTCADHKVLSVFMRQWTTGRLESLCDLSQPMTDKTKKLFNRLFESVRYKSFREDCPCPFLWRLKSFQEKDHYSVYKKLWERGWDIKGSIWNLLQPLEKLVAHPGVFPPFKDSRAHPIAQRFPDDADLNAQIDYLIKELQQTEKRCANDELSLRLHWAIFALTHPESLKKEAQAENAAEATSISIQRP